MKLGLVFLAAVALLPACSNNKCKLDSSAKKEAFGALAGMTAGAFNCRVEGEDVKASKYGLNAKCEVGAAGCDPMMFAIHAKTTVAVVAPRYRAFLEKNQWQITDEKTVTGKFGNGKPFEGKQLVAKKGTQGLVSRVVPFGDDMVETTTMLVNKPGT